MEVEYQERDAGLVGLKPDGPWTSTREYSRLECVLHNHDSWVSLKSGNKNNEPTDGSAYWMRQTEGGQHSYEQGEAAKAKGNTAQQQGAKAEEQGNDAEQKGETAEAQGKEAERQAERCETLADHPDEIRSDGYIYHWNTETKQMEKTSRRVVANLDISQLTTEQQQELMSQFVMEYAEEDECRDIVRNYQ